MQNINFKNALEAGHIEPTMLNNGQQLEIEGRKYYNPADSGSKINISRFHSAMDILRSHEELKLSYDMNLASWEQVKELSMSIMSSSNPDHIKEMAKDLMQLQSRVEARINFGRDIEQVYQITAIWFITEEEDPASVNPSIIARKIKDFKAKPELYSFFLSLPLSSLVDLSLVSNTATLNYLKEMNIQELLELKTYLLKSQIYGVDSDTTRYISSRMETLHESLPLINSLLSNTMTP